jgi:dihydroorotate dehydrogenase
MWDFYRNLIRPALFRIDAERAHEAGSALLRSTLRTKQARTRMSGWLGVSNPVEKFNLTFSNPLGVAAGFDKNGAAVNQLAALGFAFVEVGTITFDAQAGNDRPRLFRLPADEALINRAGFNNDGAGAVTKRLRALERECVVGVNIGKNKSVSNEDAAENYLAVLDLAHPVADYIVVNVSSPNTPHLRELQKAEALERLLVALQARNQALKPKPLLLKIAPDISESELEAVADICIRLNLSGIVATNTTTSRENLKTNKNLLNQIGNGGLSGRPLNSRSNQVIGRIYELTKGKLPIIGVGGIFSAADAFEKIELGASLLQSYTGFIYGGFTFARDINRGLVRIARENGFDSINEAVGTRVKV